jgi:hypothetical protein
MCPHVLGKLVGPRERFVARLADLGLLPRMRPHMTSQVAGLQKRLAARLADARPLPQMRPQVPEGGRTERMTHCTSR